MSEGRLDNRSVLITGAGKGVGRAIALLFARHGANITIADIDEQAGLETMERILSENGSAKFFLADVGRVRDLQELAQAAIQTFGKVDILVNNAGYIQNLILESITEADWNRMMDVNLRSVFFLTQSLMEHMIENRYGRVINMASQAGKTGGLKTGAHYAASKAGILSLTKSFAKTLSPYGITVNTISPGVVDTELSRSVHGIEDIIRTIPVGRAAAPEEIAAAALFLAGEDANYITGECLDVNGGLLMD